MSSSTSSLFTPLQFTGISKYSSDFQTILSRAVSIAELPIRILQNQVADIQSGETDLSALATAASAVGSSLQALGQLGSTSSLSSTSSDSNVVTATSTGAASGTSYSITNVTSIASKAMESSLKSYADKSSTQVSTAGNMTFTFGSTTYGISLLPAENNLTGLMNAINKTGAAVTASIVTTGAGSYLSVKANNTGQNTLTLTDDSDGSSFLTSANQGSNTKFLLNGVPISESTTTITDVTPGLTLNFAGKTAANETVTVGVSTDRSKIATALQTLATNYNSLATLEHAQISTTAGSLSGNSIIYQIRAAMSSIVNYQGSGSMGNLANLGIEMSTSGVMSFNQDNFDSLTDSQVSQALTLLGSSTTGIGGLQQTFKSITDPITGSIAGQETQWNTTIARLNDQITTKSNQVQAMEQTLNQHLQASDALLARLSSQQDILTASITSLDYTSYGYNTSISTNKQT